MRFLVQTALCLAFLLPPAFAQESHDHGIPEKLGKVSFPVSCAPAVQDDFNRAVALLHSFAYTAAEHAFQGVAERDPQCAMAHWGVAMTHFHQLWDPPLPPAAASVVQKEIAAIAQTTSATAREQGFIRAIGLLVKDADTAPYPARALAYENAMRELAAANPHDVESQVFYALALLANASPSDRTHALQKQAVSLLEPLYRAQPEHPGIAHYLIHACDNAELARNGLPAARDYARIAPSAPHALHMPSHIFTRLGLWHDSITSNTAAREAAHRDGDTGEELHAMDYLVYAYLQTGKEQEAAQVIEDLKGMRNLRPDDFKIAYAAAVMPVRFAIERGEWADAAALTPPAGAPPHVVAVVVWARGLGLARSGHPAEARADVARLQDLAAQLRNSGRDYWATQVSIQAREVAAWAAQAEGKSEDAARELHTAADEEDAIEKLPVTPGPVIPAREQLGDLLLQQKHLPEARKEFEQSLSSAPGRRGATNGLATASGATAQ
jgi:tetratricopeptide (TPR) repeat protein